MQIRAWWTRARVERAQALLNRHGLTVVKIVHQAGTTYLVNKDGSYLKLVREKK